MLIPSSTKVKTPISALCSLWRRLYIPKQGIVRDVLEGVSHGVEPLKGCFSPQLLRTTNKGGGEVVLSDLLIHGPQ